MANPELPAIFAEMIDAYDLELFNYHLKPQGGNRATNIIVQTSKGKKLVKKYKETLGRSTIVMEHSILEYLKMISFPAPHLYPSNSGDTLIECDNHFFAVFDYIEGGFQYQHYFLATGNQNRFIQIAGHVLGQLHRNLEDFLPQGYNPDGFKSKTEGRHRDMNWYLERLEHCIKQNGNGNSDKKTNLLQERSEYLKEEMCRLEDLLNRADLPRTVIHGDYGPYNLLFKKNGSVFVLDFEMARFEWRVAEIIRSWYRFCYDRSGFNLSKMQLLLDSYQADMPLTAEECQLIPEVWKFFNLRRTIRSWYRYHQASNAKMIMDAHQCLERIEWIETNQRKLLDIVGS